MAEISTIARPYAEALFRVASTDAPVKLGAWADLLDELATVGGHPDMLALASNPSVTHAQVYEILTGVVKTALDAHAKNFIHELVDHGRLPVLPEIAAQFRTLKNSAEGTADAEITSAFPLSTEQIAGLLTALETSFKTRLNASVTVDSNLIGGIRVVVGDRVLDTSVRARLDQMRTALVA